MTIYNSGLKALWEKVNEIAKTTEDAVAIRELIRQAGIEPNVHVGSGEEEFTIDMRAEWILGQWANIIDEAPYMLNSARNISLQQFEQAYKTTDESYPVNHNDICIAPE